MFKIELCYFFIIFVMPSGLLRLNDANWQHDSSLYFHLARYTQIALRCNVHQSHIEGTESANVCFFSYKKCHWPPFSGSFFKKVCFALVSQ